MKNWKNTIGVFWALNRGLKLADDTKFVLGENDAEHGANICFFSTFGQKSIALAVNNEKYFARYFLGEYKNLKLKFKN